MVRICPPNRNIHQTWRRTRDGRGSLMRLCPACSARMERRGWQGREPRPPQLTGWAKRELLKNMRFVTAGDELGRLRRSKDPGSAHGDKLRQMVRLAEGLKLPKLAAKFRRMHAAEMQIDPFVEGAHACSKCRPASLRAPRGWLEGPDEMSWGTGFSETVTTLRGGKKEVPPEQRQELDRLLREFHDGVAHTLRWSSWEYRWK